MTSRAQQRANRVNSLLSTGPKTALGKQRSRVNSFKHGLTKPLDLFSDDAEFLEAVELIKLEGFGDINATEIATALYEHRRVMELYRISYIDQKTMKGYPFWQVRNMPEIYGLDDALSLPNISAHELIAVMEERISMSQFIESLFWKRARLLKRFGRYQRSAISKLSKAIRRN